MADLLDILQEQVSPKIKNFTWKQLAIKGLRDGTRYYFGFVPKSTVGLLLLAKDQKSVKNAVLLAKKNGGGLPLYGVCTGALNSKEFVLFKKHDDPKDLCKTLCTVAKKTLGLSLIATARIKGEKDTDMEEDDDEGKK